MILIHLRDCILSVKSVAQETAHKKSKSSVVKKEEINDIPLSLCLSPSGHLYLYTDVEVSETIPKSMGDKIHSFFAISESVALLRLGLTHFDVSLPPSFSFWQQFSQIFITEVCKLENNGEKSTITHIVFPLAEMNELIVKAPFIRGIEYLNSETAEVLWQSLTTALNSELSTYDGLLSDYLSSFNVAWTNIGRVCFHLAENKTNPNYPFAFLATYTTGLSKTTNTQHLPLGKALEEYADKNKKSSLLSLLLPVRRAAEKSIFLNSLVETKKIFKPLAWTGQEAYQFLKDIPLFESAGVMVRVPNWWDTHRQSRPTIKIAVGDKKNSQIGLGALLDFDMKFSLPTGEELTLQEFQSLLNSTEKLVQIKGQWVHVDNEKLTQVLSHWKNIEKKIKKEGLTFAEGLRLLSGVSQHDSEDIDELELVTWSTVVEGDWLHSTMDQLRNASLSKENEIRTLLKKSLKAELRPYQEQGVHWLWCLYNLRLGGCLADDMGLGKTIQVISLLLLIKYKKEQHQPHLLILPASLLGNWQAEINRFAPDLTLWTAHNSSNREDNQPDLNKIDLIITTYGTLSRIPWLNETSWDIVILDEAQAIKNPTAKQTRAIKLLKSQIRFVLTGTPIENRLLDLWSLFDFVAPGLLGSSRAFGDLGKKTINQKNNGEGQFYAAVRRLVNPYILRRLKNDKRIISDLPDKTEMQTYCTLTKQQAGLYQQAVNELAAKLETQESSINRRGLVMSYLLRFKQICNHPNQWLGHNHYAHEHSGKFLRLKELCDVIADKQEKVLVFTQFREIIPAITEFLCQVFKRDGLFLDGKTSIKDRAKRVEQFQQDQGPPFFVLSLKAGGTGLNLTAASHVIHFDRWWNPAVENQATDRAYRIGQKKNVLVHKFICLGTIEEKIDSLLSSKKSLSDEIMNQNDEIVLTELSNAELMNIVTLDLHRALGEN
jgi:superfamily II DNA or RNA helicase